jgi:hypothetical protein
MKYFPLALIAVISLSFQKQMTVQPFHWLIGTWKQEGKEEFEKWHPGNDTLMAAMAYYYELEGDEKDGEVEMMVSETIRLIVRGDKYYYIPLVRNQKNGKEVEFEVVSFTKNSFVAENLKHDFPQRIAYKLIDEKHLSAYIEGSDNGKNKKIDFFFTKVE